MYAQPLPRQFLNKYAPVSRNPRECTYCKDAPNGSRVGPIISDSACNLGSLGW